MQDESENNELLHPIADFIKSHVGVVCHEWIISMKEKRTEAHSFSCVFVQTDSKYYVVTARHCLEDLCESSRIMISTFNNRLPDDTIRFGCKDNVNFGIPKSKRIDISYLEVDEKTARSFKVRFFPSYNCISQDHKDDTRVCLIGFPRQFVHQNFIPTKSDKPKFNLLAKPFICWTNISNRIPQERSVLDYEPDLNIDIFIEYDPEKIYDVENDMPLLNIRPQGMSGCGVFRVSTNSKKEIWSALDINLIGIQSSYYEKDKLLKATRIERLFEI